MDEVVVTSYALAGEFDEESSLEIEASPQFLEVCLPESADAGLERTQAEVRADMEFSLGEPDIPAGLYWQVGPWMPGDPAGGRPYREAHLYDSDGEPWAMIVQQRVRVS